MPLPDTAAIGRFRRRAALYGRRTASTLAGGLRRPCLFVHLPKCGGTSLADGLYGTVPLHRRIGVIDAPATRRAAAIAAFDRDDPLLCHEDLAEGYRTFALREHLALTHMCWGTPLVHGHLLCTGLLVQAAENGGYGMVTMMRDPEARALSNYRMAVRAGVLPADPDAWLDGPVGRSMSQAALRYLSGWNAIPEAGVDAALRRASATLSRFALVGMLDRADAFRDAFAARFGARPAMPRLNRAPEPAGGLSPRQAAKLRALTEPDRALLDLARQRFPEACGESPARTGPRPSPAGRPATARHGSG